MVKSQTRMVLSMENVKKCVGHCILPVLLSLDGLDEAWDLVL